MAEKPASDKEKQNADSASGSDAKVDKKADDKKADKLPPSIVKFNAEISIDSAFPLPQYDSGPVKAYKAVGSGPSNSAMFALICENNLSPRTNVGATYSKVLNPSLVNLVGSAVVEWPIDGKHHYVLLYEDNLGAPLVEKDKGAYGMSQDLVMEKIIRPMVSALLDLRDKDMVHGAIRPTNIYNGGSETLERIVLGDCLANPSWATMPVTYLPLDKAMADPVARGRGTPADDLYAFGVTLCVLLREIDPLANADDEGVIKAKLEGGTYIALTGKHRFTGGILELLRGLLFDDVAQRWTIDEVQAWMDGRRLSPKQSQKKPKASRPLELLGKKYIYPEILAIDMNKNVSEAAHIIENDELDQWLKRAVEDKPLIERVEKARDLANDKGKGPGYQQRLVTRVGIALDPSGPIRFRNIRFMPEGIGPALTYAYATKRDIKDFVDIFTEYFAMQWIDMNRSGNIDVGALMTKFDSCRAFVRQTGIGFGYERCIYFLDPCAPCLSDKVIDYYVRNSEDLMYAFEKLSASSKRPQYFFDRHIAAFLSVKDRKDIDAYLYDLGAPETFKRILGELRVLATIQKRGQLGSYPGIANWVASILGPVYERFHDRTLQDEVKQKVEKLKKKGDLTKIAALFDDPVLYSADSSAFFKAIHEYVRLKNEKAELQRKLADQKTYGQEAGNQAAAILSCLLAIIVILGSTFMAISSYFTG